MTTLREARANVEALRGFADLAYYRPSQHMTADEYADALKAYAAVMGYLDACPESTDAKPFDTSPEPVKNGPDSLHVSTGEEQR